MLKCLTEIFFETFCLENKFVHFFSRIFLFFLFEIYFLDFSGISFSKISLFNFLLECFSARFDYDGGGGIAHSCSWISTVWPLLVYVPAHCTPSFVDSVSQIPIPWFPSFLLFLCPSTPQSTHPLLPRSVKRFASHVPRRCPAKSLPNARNYSTPRRLRGGLLAVRQYGNIGPNCISLHKLFTFKCQ